MLCVKLFIRRGKKGWWGLGHGHVMHYAVVSLISFHEIKAITSNSSCYTYQYIVNLVLLHFALITDQNTVFSS